MLLLIPLVVASSTAGGAAAGFELPLRGDLGEARIDDEDAILADTVQVLTDIVTTKLEAQGQHALRDVHAKASGCMTARFVVHDPPPALRHGVFATDHTYDAVVRFSSSELGPLERVRRSYEECD